MLKFPAYDPRDPSQDPNDPSTWKVTDNPALLAVRFIDGQTVGMDWEVVARSAGYCEELVPIKTKIS